MAASSIPILLLLLLLLIPPISGDLSDESCLSGLLSSLAPASKSALHNWTAPNLASPCSSNGFTALISGATCNNGRVFKLSLPNLALAGTLPPLALANCTSLQSLDLSSNLLHGPIPLSFSALLNLAVLNLSANVLSGPIPPQLALCAYLNVIDLHSNRLTGPIPDQLGSLVRLSVFDVSDNQLEGPIPVSLANRTGGMGPRFNRSSFDGNRGLYGYPLAPGKGKGLSVMAIVGIGLGSGLMSLLVSFTAVCIWLRVTERNSMMANGDGEEKMSHFMPDY